MATLAIRIHKCTIRVLNRVVVLVLVAPLIGPAQTVRQPGNGSLARQGYSLTATQAQQLEQQLKANPEDLSTRAKLLGYWFSRGRQDTGEQSTIAARRRHILWLIANHPDSELCGSSEATLDPDHRYNSLADRTGYQQARQLWIEQTSRQSVKLATLKNAGFFFKLPDKPLAASMYARLETLDPGEPRWKILHATVLAYAIVGLAALNQNGFPLAVDPAEAGSEFAKNVRSDLEATRDVNLLLGVSGVLTMQGMMVARDRTGIMGLAEHYAKRAQELDPANQAFATPQLSDRELAETYELRALQSRDAAERADLLRRRLELLEKSFANVSRDDPGKARELLMLARARADAGEIGRAAELARALLRLASQIEKDRENHGSYDEVRHHSHLILGRAALRAGDPATAGQELLAAGKVGGGGTLSSFGPNMVLAKELLERGSREVVIQYLEECRSFWKLGRNLDNWITAIRNGRIPEFGANLIY